MSTLPNLSNITLNGQPLTFIVNEQINDEINQAKKIESWHRPVVSRQSRNISGARSGKCRVIFSAGGQA